MNKLAVCILMVAALGASHVSGSIDHLKARLRDSYFNRQGGFASASASAGGFGFGPTVSSSVNVAHQPVAKAFNFFNAQPEAEPEAPPAPAAPVKPTFNFATFAEPNPAKKVASHGLHKGSFGPAFATAKSAASGFGSQAAAASSAFAGNSQPEEQNYETKSVAAAASGTYSNSDVGHESSAYRQATENVSNHESGNVNDNHYLNAQSYGKSEDENLHEAFSKNDEDIEATAHRYKSKKSGENYKKTYNKAVRATGSGVLAKDKHKSGYKKNNKKFTNNIDQRQQRFGNGVFENVHDATSEATEDEDEDLQDSDGFQPIPSFAASAAKSAYVGRFGNPSAFATAGVGH